jgi:hypothetical protein
MSNVVSPWGHIPPEKAVNEDLVNGLEKLLERARAGEAVGAVVAYCDYDSNAGFSILGTVGTYSLVGAMTLAARNLEHITNSG